MYIYGVCNTPTPNKEKRKKVYSQSSHNMFPKSWTKWRKWCNIKGRIRAFASILLQSTNSSIRRWYSGRLFMYVSATYMIHNKISVIYVRFIYLVENKNIKFTKEFFDLSEDSSFDISFFPFLDKTSRSLLFLAETIFPLFLSRTCWLL